MTQVYLFSLYNFLYFNSMWYVIVTVLHVVGEAYQLRDGLLADNSVQSCTIIDPFAEIDQAPSNKNRSRHLSTQLPKHHFNYEMSYICFNYYEKHSNSYIPGLGRKRRTRTTFTKTQLAELESQFQRTHYVDFFVLQMMSNKLNLKRDRIRIWFKNRRRRAKLETNQENRMLFVDLNGNLEIRTHCKGFFENNGSVSPSSSSSRDEQQSFSFPSQFLQQYCPTSGNFFHLDKKNHNLCCYKFDVDSTLTSQLLHTNNTTINSDSKRDNPALPADLSAPSLHTMHNCGNVSKKTAETMEKNYIQKWTS